MSEHFFSNQKNNPISLPQNFSDERMARDWTLSEEDIQEVGKYRKDYRAFIALQLCALRLYGYFLADVNALSPKIVNYINGQLGLSPSLTIDVPEREVTFHKHRKRILSYLDFQRFGEESKKKLELWLDKQVLQRVGRDPDGIRQMST